MLNTLAARATLMTTRICPVAPPGAQANVNHIEGYVLWGIGILFGIGVLIGLGAIIAGRIFGLPHASKAGVVSIVIVFVCIIAFFTLPGMVSSMMGNGCVG